MGERKSEGGERSEAISDLGHASVSDAAVVESESERRSTSKRRGFVQRWTVRLLKSGVGSVLLYLGIVLVGLIPVNNDFVESDDGVEIHLASTMVHAVVIVPVATHVFDWRDEFPVNDFAGSTRRISHVAIGWGDRGFFFQCPTWDDVTAPVVGSALFWPTESCLHVTFGRPDRFTGSRPLRISDAEYRKLVEVIRSRFLRDADGRVKVVPGERYTFTDAFYEARGRYHALNTCNSWIGHVLRESGVRTPWLTPLPKSMFLYLP